jgi:hypothetical protein
MDIDVEKIAICDPWSDAPIGAILVFAATKDGNPPFFALRSEFTKPGDPPLPCLVVLDGHDRGQIRAGLSFDRKPALDVSDLVAIVIADACPMLQASKDAEIGVAYKLDDVDGPVVYAEFAGSGGTAMYVGLAGERRGQQSNGDHSIRLGAVRVEPKVVG